MDAKDTGILLNPVNIKLHREYFEEMTRLIGIQVIYRAPRENKTYNGYGELDTYFYEPTLTGCIFQEHPSQWTMKKLGWNSEVSEGASLIDVPYDLPRLQRGALFIIPSGIDNAEGRLFRVERMKTEAVYPASITCEIFPVWASEFEQSQLDFSKDNFNLLSDEEEEQ